MYIEVQSITKKYFVDAWNTYIYALRNVSIRFGSGIHFILGPNGSGKSTLLRIMAGITIPDEGYVYLFGRRIYGPDCSDECLSELRRIIGYLPQNLLLINNLSAEYNIALPLWLRRDTSGWRDRVRKIAELFNIKRFLSKKVGSLSIGQRQLVAICRALIMDPKLILLDEPFSHIDNDAQDALMKYLDHVSDDRVIIITSPKEDYIKNLGSISVSSVVKLDEGRVVSINYA